MLVFSALVAGSFALGTRMANDISPSAFNAVRFILAAGVLIALAASTTGVPPKAWRAPWRYGVLGATFAVYFVLMFEGLKTAPPVSAAAVFTLIPVMSAAFGWWLLRQRTTGRMALALAIGAVGALWVIFRGQVSALLAFDVGRGELIYFVGCVFHAIYTPLVRKLNRGEPALVFAGGTLCAGAVVLLLWGARDLLATDWASLPMLVWVTLAYIVIFATAASFSLLQFATLHLPSAKVMAYSYLTPTWVIGWEIALGGAVPGLIVLFGVALSALALLMLLRNDELREP